MLKGLQLIFGEKQPPWGKDDGAEGGMTSRWNATGTAGPAALLLLLALLSQAQGEGAFLPLLSIGLSASLRIAAKAACDIGLP